jgi:hypothetical protein
MSDHNPEHRIISWENLAASIELDVPFRRTIQGSPESEIFFDALNRQLGFRYEIADDIEVDFPIEPKTIAVQRVNLNEKPFLELRSGNQSLFRTFYSFGIEIVDQVQLFEREPISTFKEIWVKWNLLLEDEGILSKEKQLGLLGELWLLKSLSKTSGWGFALDSWHDTANSEHDFGLPNIDIEVKSTTSELRKHQISSLTQLLPTKDRELFLVSFQFTPCNKDVEGALSLQTQTRAIEEVIDDQELVNRFKARLRLAGWREEHSMHYGSSYLLRTKPRLIKVDDQCPRLTPDLLNHIDPIVMNGISDVRYRIDVTGLGSEIEDGDVLASFKG